jgi:hypothetical protein
MTAPALPWAGTGPLRSSERQIAAVERLVAHQRGVVEAEHITDAMHPEMLMLGDLEAVLATLRAVAGEVRQ